MVKQSTKFNPSEFKQLRPDAAGIDIGATGHYVAVPEGRDKESVCSFGAFTSDLHRIADWLKKCRIKTVVMESTGVYWIPLFEVLEEKGFEVYLVDARHVKNVSGRKSDVLDCQWLQQLHSYGLLQPAFRPEEKIAQLRSYVRQRSMLIQAAASHVQHMQKALSMMNVHIHNVVSDITGDTGMTIVRAIVSGERNPAKLAQNRHHRCKNSQEVFEKSLEGNYRSEHVFALKQALELYDIYQEKARACETEIQRLLTDFDNRGEPNECPPRQKPETRKHRYSFDLSSELVRMTGVDLTSIPGINSATALLLLSEIGLDMSRWHSGKCFASWLGLAPGTKISGGRRLSSRTKPVTNRAATALRIAAMTLHHSKTALGAFFRRVKSRHGGPKAITATAHKLARLVYALLKAGSTYVEQGQEYYEERYRERVIKSLNSRAKSLGLRLCPIDEQVKTQHALI